MNRIAGSNFEEALRSKVVNEAISTETLSDRIFYFGQVVVNDDPKNISRIKVRIPVLDDKSYSEGTQEEGDQRLTWCLPMSHRFINIPEVNSIVIVALLDPKIPYYGRIYLDTVTGLSDEDLFTRLNPEENPSNWSLPEDAIERLMANKPVQDSMNAADNVKFPIGIRGRGKNKFVLNETDSEWIQNESKVKLDENFDVDAEKDINLISQKGTTDRFHPVFHTPLYKHLDRLNTLLQKIILVLTTIPANSTTGPCLPGPGAKSLPSALADVAKSLAALRKPGNGHSDNININ